MAAAELKELIELAKEAGLQGDELSVFLRDERARQRDCEREREERVREREREERERESEMRKREAEDLQRDADRRHELELAKLKVETIAVDQTGPVSHSRGFGAAVPKLPTFDDRTDDLDAYLHRFEGYATAQDWPRERWACNLSALLKGNALQTFHRMTIEDANDYNLLKVALLNRFRLTDVDFKIKFRRGKPEDGESFTQFGQRIASYLDRWLELSNTSKTFESLRDLMICEQVMGVGSTDLKVFIQERNPNSFKATCDIAEQYLKAHGKSFRNWSASTVNNFGERGDARHNDNGGYRSANLMQRSNSSTGHSR